MKEFLTTIAVLTIALLFCLAQDAKGAVVYSHSNEQFEPVMELKELQSIETWQQPTTQYTPKNLRTQYQIRFNGKMDKGVGSYTMPITDYDTYINTISKDEETGKMYVHDNAGRKILTGIDNSRQIENIEKSVTNKTNLLEKNVNRKINNLSERLSDTHSQISKLDGKIESGLATVTALTGLHPNPRSDEKLEVSVASGMYADNVAGAIGLFYHPHNRVQLNAGFSYGGDSQFAGNVGITFGIGRRK